MQKWSVDVTQREQIMTGETIAKPLDSVCFHLCLPHFFIQIADLLCSQSLFTDRRHLCWHGCFWRWTGEDQDYADERPGCTARFPTVELLQEDWKLTRLGTNHRVPRVKSRYKIIPASRRRSTNYPRREMLLWQTSMVRQAPCKRQAPSDWTFEQLQSSTRMLLVKCMQLLPFVSGDGRYFVPASSPMGGTGRGNLYLSMTEEARWEYSDLYNLWFVLDNLSRTTLVVRSWPLLCWRPCRGVKAYTTTS